MASAQAAPTPLSTQTTALLRVRGCPAGPSGPSAMRNPPAARRACAAASCPARPAEPAGSPPHRQTPARPGGPAAWPSSGRRPVGQVILKRGEAQLRGAGGELLVGGGTALAGGGHLAGWRGKACLIEQVADRLAGGGKLAGQLGGAGLLLGARQQVTVKVDVPLRVSVVVEALLLGVEDRE